MSRVRFKLVLVLMYGSLQGRRMVSPSTEASFAGFHPALKLVWVLCHGLASVKLIQHFLRTFPLCAFIGKTFLVTFGIVLYFGDMLLLTIKKGLVLGLLLYPIALKYILQICEWFINTASTEAKRYCEIGRSLMFVASLGIVLILIVPSWMKFVHEFRMHPFFWVLSFVFS
ncbi:Dolichol kinase EVAN [Glycine max]|nr:Dolichol kinase EVAN [Glycine max]